MPATNALDNAQTYLGMLTTPVKERPVDPPDGSTINGREAVDDAEAALITEARLQQRAAGAAMVAGIGRKD